MSAPDISEIGLSFLENVIHFLVSLQTSKSQEEEFEASYQDSTPENAHQKAHLSQTPTSTTPNFQIQGGSINSPQDSAPNIPESSLSEIQSPPLSLAATQIAGFSGRCNKIADTCYSFWAGGALAVRSP